jgi:hypothetical protein
MQAMDDELARRKADRTNVTRRSGTSDTLPTVNVRSNPAAKATSAGKPTGPAQKEKGKGKAPTKPKVSFADDVDMSGVVSDDDEIDIEAAMDAELRAALSSGPLGDEGDSDAEEGDVGADYNLIKNFLESFKSQAGLAGPVGNLAGRLQPGWTLPRDES